MKAVDDGGVVVHVGLQTWPVVTLVPCCEFVVVLPLMLLDSVTEQPPAAWHIAW